MRTDQQLNVKLNPVRVKVGTAGVGLKSDTRISKWIKHTFMIFFFFFSLCLPAFLGLVCFAYISIRLQLNSGSSFFSPQ